MTPTPHQPDSSIDIEALRKAAEAASPGPWKLYKAPLRPQFPVMVHEIQKDGSEPIVNWGGFDGLQRAKSKITADARYIAAANPAVILTLLDERRALLDRLERAEAANQAYCGIASELVKLKAELAPNVVGQKPTNLSKRLRDCAADPMYPKHASVSKLLLTQAADEIDRYSSEMLAKKGN